MATDHAAFKQAVAKVYSDVCVEVERKAAEDWLTSWRKQPSAWQTAETILHDDSTTSEEKYMAAHTLCTKVPSDLRFAREHGVARLNWHRDGFGSQLHLAGVAT